MVDFHAGEGQPLPLPIADQLLDLLRDLVLVQRLELAIKANYCNQRPAITLEQCRIDPRPTPACLRECL
ncbi:hypothetical protein D3C84_585930 [compost metagenome]